MRKTNLIIVLCFLFTLFAWSLDQKTFSKYLAFSGINLIKGRFWTLFTALFIHGNWVHLIGNMLFLYVFGNTVEEELGSARTLFLFFLGGALAFLLSIYFYDPSTLMIGASAAIFTLTATVILIKPLKFSFLFFMPLGLVAVIYFIYNLVAVQLAPQSNVAYISHLIGFAIGIPFGIVWSKDWTKNLLITIIMFMVYLLITYYLRVFLVGPSSIL